MLGTESHTQGRVPADLECAAGHKHSGRKRQSFLIVDIKCEEVVREISNYLDGEVDAALGRRMEAHFKLCRHCSAVLDGARNVVRLVGDERAFDLPQGFGRRLAARLQESIPQHAPLRRSAISLGITDDQVELGSHLIYFWQDEAQFERGVRFLELGLRAGDHSALFGHIEATDNALSILRQKGFDPGRLIAEHRLTVLRREASAVVTLSNISQVFENALRGGAPAIRFLGNLGMGRDLLPGRGEDEVLELENSVTAMAARFPCVVVCMYDVNTLPGRLIMKGGFETHPLAVCGSSLQPNPYYLQERSVSPKPHVH